MGIGLNDEMLKELREENVADVKSGEDTQTSVYYIESTPFKSDNLKSRMFSKQGLRGEPVVENIPSEERTRMEDMANFNEVIYNRRKAYGMNLFGLDERKAYRNIPNQDVNQYKFSATENDLTGLFINDDKQEVVIATRGILPFYDRKDTLQTIPMVSGFLTEQKKPESFGNQFKQDRKMLDEVYRQVKIKYPNYKVVATGHSRGGQATIYLGRKHGLEYHAFSPVGNKADYIDQVPVLGGNIYYHTKDPVSYHFHKRKGKTIEQHYELFNTRINPHSVGDFKDRESVVIKHAKLSQADQLGLEEEILLDMTTKEEDIITPEEYVLSDLGIFDEFEEFRSAKKDVFVYDPYKDEKNKNTQALLGADTRENNIFNEYVPSVFNDLNMKPSKPFKPTSYSDLDVNNDGKISFNEFKRYFNKLDYDDDTIKKLFNTYDVDKNNSIDKQEFNQLINVL